jgi:multisubunit Na+/H+ antiporter MnhB subunit
MLTKNDIENYFLAEKLGGMTAICIGIVAIIAAICCYFFIKNNWTNGFVIPLIVVGIVQLVVGYIVYNRSDNDRKNMVYAYDMSPEKLRNEELPRMEKVAKSFTVLKYVQIALIITSILIIILWNHNINKTFWVGLATGLLFQATASFAFDAVAEKRGNIYLEKLREF